MMGRAKKITITKDDTIILDGSGDKSAIGERCDQIREAIAQSQSDYDRCFNLSLPSARACQHMHHADCVSQMHVPAVNLNQSS